MRHKTLKAAAIIQCAVIFACTALALLYSIPLSLGILLTALAYHWFNGEDTKDISKFKFYKLHDVPEYIEETATLVTSEWPAPVTDKGTSEHNHVRLSSMKESCDSMPCHLVALASCGKRNEVAAHVVLRESPGSSRDIERFVKMLKAGIPLAAVHQAMQVAGLAPPDISSPEQPDQSKTFSTKTFRTASVGNPRELKRYVRMLKAGLSVATVHQAMQVAGLAPPDLFSPEVSDHSPPSSKNPPRTTTVNSLTEYKKFAEMLKAGIPAAAVQQAMQVAGLNPSDFSQSDKPDQSATSSRESFGHVNEEGHRDLKRVAKMLKAGVPVEAVRQVMQAAGFVSSDLPNHKKKHHCEISSEKEIESVTVATLNNEAKSDLVSGHQRRQGSPQALDGNLKRFYRMLKAGVPVAAVQQAMQIAGVEPLEVISSEDLDKLALSSEKDAQSVTDTTLNNEATSGLTSCSENVEGSARSSFRKSPNGNRDLKRFVKMLKAGIPVAAVQQAMKVASLNLSDLSSPEELEQSVTSWRKTIRSVSVDGRKDLKRFTKMLKAGVPVAAVRQAMQVAGIVPSDLSSHEKSDQSALPPKKPLKGVTASSLRDLTRLAKMLKAGVPVEAVEQAMLIALLNTSYVSIPKNVDLSKTSSENEVRSVNNEANSDLVLRHKRRQHPPQALDSDLKRFHRMLKAGVPVAAVQQAMQIAGVEPLEVISSEDLDRLALSSEKDAQSVTDTTLNNEATSGLASCSENVEGSARSSFRKSPNGNRDLKRFVKMLKAGVPVAAVQQAMKVASLNLSDLSSPEELELEQSVTSWRKTIRSVSVDGRKDLKRFTKMLKAGVPVAAVRQAMQVAGIVPSDLSSHEKSDQSALPPKKPLKGVTASSLRDLTRLAKMLKAGVPVEAVEQAMLIALLNTSYVSIPKNVDLSKTSSENVFRSVNNEAKSDLVSGHKRRQHPPQALDRNLKKFRRMLKAGVPVAAVQQAMQIAGVEPVGGISSDDVVELTPSLKRDAEGVTDASKTPNSSHDMKRFIKMLKAGVPVAAVQQAMQLSGVNPSDLSSPDKPDQHVNLSKTIRRVTVDSLTVFERFVKMLKAGVPVAAVQQAMQVAGIVSPDVSTPEKSDQSATFSKNPNRRVSFCSFAVFNRFVKMLKAGVPVAAVEQAMQVAGLDPSGLSGPEKPGQLVTSSRKSSRSAIVLKAYLNRFAKMLNAGVPVAAVQQAMQVAGLVSPDVSIPEKSDQSATSSSNPNRRVSFCSLAVFNRFVKMLKAGVPVAAVEQAMQVAGLDPSGLSRFAKMLKAGVPVAAVQQATQVAGLAPKKLYECVRAPVKVVQSLNCKASPSSCLTSSSETGESTNDVALRKTTSINRGLEKIVKMLKAGVPLAAVQQAMQVAVLRPSVSAYHGMPDQSALSSGKEVPSFTVSSLVVKPEFRGQGLGKAMCAFAVQVASGLGLGVTEANGACRDELVPFYEKLGARKRSAEKRKGIPKVRLGNYMSIRIDSVATDKAAKVLASFIGK